MPAGELFSKQRKYTDLLHETTMNDYSLVSINWSTIEAVESQGLEPTVRNSLLMTT